ncbi:MAG: calcium/sodium antiporter [Candidatus Omnitrophota bacterium]|nr:MAG: calcium/sodium antiporter [Candidatus Omnitrophota bacterium]
MMPLNTLLFIIGLILLYAGGEVFIKGSTSIAYLFGLRPLIVAATVAAFATSAPEFVVCLTAAVRNSRNLALGNIIGSCIANIALILGICSLIRPINIERSLLRKELPILIVVSVSFFLICLNLYISKAEAFLLLFGFCLFIYYCVKNAKQEKNALIESRYQSKLKSFVFIGLATLLLVSGSNLLVKSAVALANYFGISQLVIGLTIVAVGTSLPELSVSAVASARGKHETAIGNVIGSNIFNILLIIGAICLVRPIFISPATIRFEIPLMVAYSILLLPLLRTGFKLSRLEGFILLLSYAVYIWILFNRR